MNRLDLKMKKSVKYIVIWIVLTVLCCIGCELILRARELELSDNDIVVTGITRITTSTILNLSEIEHLPGVRGSNWRIEITNLDNFTYTIRLTSNRTLITRTIQTNNLTINGSGFYPDRYASYSMNGTMNINEIYYAGDYEEDFYFYVEDGNFSIANLSQIGLYNSILFHDGGEEYIKSSPDNHLVQFNFTSNPIIRVTCEEGTYLDLISYLSEMKINGKIKIDRMKNAVGINGNLYLNTPITFKGKDMRIITSQMPDEGSDGTHGWVEYPEYWIMRIQSEKGVTVKGDGIPYWILGPIISTYIVLVGIVILRIWKKNKEKTVHRNNEHKSKPPPHNPNL